MPPETIYTCITCGGRFLTEQQTHVHADYADHTVITRRGSMPPRETTWVVLEEFESSSSDVIYEVRRGHDGVVYCTCPAWRMKQGKASCKHLDAWRKDNFSRPNQTQRDASLRIQTVRIGDLVEVSCRGDIFLLKVAAKETAALRGFEVLDAGEAPCSRGGERLVDFRDVMRVVIPAS